MIPDYLDITKDPQPPRRLTQSWSVYNRKLKTRLGEIKWNVTQRTYHFYPANGVHINHQTLAAIAGHLSKENAEHAMNHF